MKKTVLLSALAFAAVSVFASPKIDTSNDRMKTGLAVPYAKLGVLTPKDVSKTHNNITVGCETLDRDYADYDAYKQYLAPLGIKKIRLQGGWAKTEKTKGVYDFAWLDKIIDDARSRGLTVWLQTSYGNSIYRGGGTPFLKGGMPSTPEGKAAWNNWVDKMAARYAGKVEWEMWNEPDINRKTPRSETVDMNIRTAEIIRKHDPNAKIAGLVLAILNPEWFEEYVSQIHKAGKMGLFDWFSYHGYEYRPEESYHKVAKMREVLKKYSDKVILRQGENGAPSKGYLGGALTDHPWTELTQAKWDLRRMLGDWGRGIETSVFSISDMRYAKGDAIKIVNVKGLLETDENNRVVKIKKAYYAVQNLAAVFDAFDVQTGAESVKFDAPFIVSAFGYTDRESGLPSYTIWISEAAPTNVNATLPLTAELVGGAKIANPVWVDILSGGVYEIPAESLERVGGNLKVKNLPVYDSPIVVTDKRLVDFCK